MFGYPNAAKYISNKYTLGKITKTELYHLVTFTNNANLAYILITVGLLMFNNINIGIILLVSHVTSAVILGIVFRPRSIIQQDLKNENSNIIIKKPIFNCVLISILDTFKTLSIIFTFTTLFNIFSTFLCTLSSNNIYKLIVTGILELSNGLYFTIQSNLGLDYKILICSLILSFGSLMIIFQVRYALTGCPIKFKRILLAKLLQSCISCRNILSSYEVHILALFTILHNIYSKYLLTIMEVIFLAIKYNPNNILTKGLFIFNPHLPLGPCHTISGKNIVLFGSLVQVENSLSALTCNYKEIFKSLKKHKT